MENDPQNPRRKVLVNCVALMAQEAGFGHVDKAALGTLVETLQGLIVELGRTTRVYTELACRVEPTVGDVTLAMTELGMKVDAPGLRSFFKRHNRAIIPNCQALHPPKPPALLSSGKRPPLPAHIPDYFPPMPDPHCFIRTPTHKQPLTDYAACREKSSQNKRDLERSLTKFHARTSPCDYIFPESSLFPLIAPKPVTYLDPLIPRDQIFEEEQNLPPLNHIRRETTEQPAKPADGETGDHEVGKKSKEKAKMVVTWELIDNPFLRPPKKIAKVKS